MFDNLYHDPRVTIIAQQGKKAYKQTDKEDPILLNSQVQVQKYRVRKIERPSAHRTVLNGTLYTKCFCQGHARLTPSIASFRFPRRMASRRTYTKLATTG